MQAEYKLAVLYGYKKSKCNFGSHQQKCSFKIIGYTNSWPDYYVHSKSQEKEATKGYIDDQQTGNQVLKGDNKGNYLWKTVRNVI